MSPDRMPELQDIKRVAERISLSASWIRKAVKAGTFPRPTLRHSRLFWRSEVVTDWIEREVPLQSEDAS